MSTHEHLERLLEMDLRSATAVVVHSQAARLPSKLAAQVLRTAQANLTEPAASRGESTRVAAAKVLVGLIPASLSLIREWFEIYRGPAFAFEVQFSILCFLDEVPAMEKGGSLSAAILATVGEYLMNVESEAAHAAWMAGDLLGNHWNLEFSLPVLLNAARRARFVAGRLGALHGIEHALEALTEDRERLRSSTMAVRQVASGDASRRVREYAELLLAGPGNI